MGTVVSRRAQEILPCALLPEDFITLGWRGQIYYVHPRCVPIMLKEGRNKSPVL